MDKINQRYGFNNRKFNFLERLFFIKPFCPACNTKMNEMEQCYNTGWKCPKCEWITWEEY